VVTQHVVDHLPITDVLLRNAELAYVVELPVLGIATRFETNSRYVRDVVEDAFGMWRGLSDDANRSPNVARVRVLVQEGTEGSDGRVRIRHVSPDPTRVIVHSPGSFGISDPARGESVAYVTTALASDRLHFRGAVLEAITLALLSHFDRHPLHASAIARGRRTLLLAAPSGTGKSTLAYAAERDGLALVSEDLVWVQLTPLLRIWGWPGRPRLLADALSLFPEAMEGATAVEADGKAKFVVDTGSPKSVLQCVVGRPVVCVLARGHGRPELERLSSAEMGNALVGDLAPGFDRFPERHTAVVSALTARGGWRLRLSGDARDAVPLLQRMLDEG
jgi:hypothetical protein